MASSLFRRSDPGLAHALKSHMNTASGRLLVWLGSGLIAIAATSHAMYREVSTFGRPEGIQTGVDFLKNTWLATRDLVSGVNIYAQARLVIPDIGRGILAASPHVPGSLLWQAPFAALPPRAAVFAYAFVSILAIWAGVFILISPKDPPSVFLAACCGAFAIAVGGGPVALLLGQPTGFTVLGLALLVRARQPWLAGLGFMLAASTLQTGLPLALALLALGNWRVVWRGAVLIVASSLPPVLLEVANAGFRAFATSFVSGGDVHVMRLSNRIDLGALLQRLGISIPGLRIGSGVLVAVLALAFLAWLPARLRRIDYPPVLCLVIAFTTLCTYHQPYDMLLVAGVVVPVILANGQSRAMLMNGPSRAMINILGLAVTSAWLSTYTIIFFYAPVALAGIGMLSALALLRAKSDARMVPELEEPRAGALT